MIALFNKLLDWFKALFWKEEMELTLVGLQYSGKTTFVNVIAVRGAGRPGLGPRRALSTDGRLAWRARRAPAGRRGLGRAGPSTALGTRQRVPGPRWHGGRGGGGRDRDLRRPGCHEARGAAVRGDGPLWSPRPGA